MPRCLARAHARWRKETPRNDGAEHAENHPDRAALGGLDEQEVRAMQVQSEGKLEWAGVVASGSPLALALLVQGAGRTEVAVMAVREAHARGARAVAIAELVMGLERLLDVLGEVDASGDAEGRSDAVERCDTTHATSQTTPPTRCAMTRQRITRCTTTTTRRPSAWTYAAPSSPRRRARCSG